MPLIWVLLVALLLGDYMLSENLNNSEQAAISAENEAISGSMQVYKNAIVKYVELTPSASGAIPDSSLGLPTWYSRFQGVSNYVAFGKVYVYYVGRGELASVIADKTESMTVGINRGGVLMNPRTGNTGIALPDVIPESSVVIMQ
ncbi:MULTISPECIES: type IV pilus biogenesis protein PilM [unclassified Pseudomonas]|uniref:type IV pilus biogenesis protein PilM n=1 Tax=unclassified Pseudomonas TaxID=196821 RepID=UPI0012FE4250|nr:MULTISPECIES: type IV pilus biogenesis protein PilM [unclassified Pseudomonas]MCU1738071.1 type IV pilus biogenesis protein PilM [Pseudomonas sp. 20S_6.2_Bac1]